MLKAVQAILPCSSPPPHSLTSLMRCHHGNTGRPPPHPSSQGPGGNSAERESESVSELCCGQIFLTHQVAICRAQEREEGGETDFVLLCRSFPQKMPPASPACRVDPTSLPPLPSRRQPITEGCVELRSLRPSKTYRWTRNQSARLQQFTFLSQLPSQDGSAVRTGLIARGCDEVVCGVCCYFSVRAVSRGSSL